ncbi:MAG: hypothetical protein EBU90_05750 [Proteobacteria bacterium]|nr:hypothetical protein [Pseudomonadota bacterium]NBP13932.1 hypothetical protein [bacterium]
MKSLLQKSMVLALSALLVSETVQAGFTGSARAGGVIKTNVKKALDAYRSPQQPDLNALQQMMTDAQSIRPGVTNGYTPKEWESLKVQVYTKAGVNLETKATDMVNAFKELIETLGLDGITVTDQLATPTVKGAQDFQAAWQAFLALGGNGSLFPNAQQQASGLLGITIDTLNTINRTRDANLTNQLQTYQDALEKIANITKDPNYRKVFVNASQVVNPLSLPAALENDARQLKNYNLNSTPVETSNKIKQATETAIRNELQPQIDALTSQKTQLEENLRKTKADLQNCTIQARTDKGKTEKQTAILEKDKAVLQQQLDACLAKDSSGLNKAVQEQIVQLQQQITQAQTTNEQVNQANAQLQQEHKDLRTALDQSTTHIGELTAQLQALQDENTQLRNARQGK